jgi:hypothetical protein
MVLKEPLKDAAVDSLPRNRRIHFDSTVMVFCIPSRHEYSNRMKKFMWHDWEEIHENAQRNRREFAAEGWDWHTVLEDDDMYVDAITGELIHPCWFNGEFDEGMGTLLEEDCFANEVQSPSLKRTQSFQRRLNDLAE